MCTIRLEYVSRTTTSKNVYVNKFIFVLCRVLFQLKSSSHKMNCCGLSDNNIIFWLYVIKLLLEVKANCLMAH